MEKLKLTKTGPNEVTASFKNENIKGGFYMVPSDGLTMFDVVGRVANTWHDPVASSSNVTNNFEGYLDKVGQCIGFSFRNPVDVPSVYLEIAEYGTSSSIRRSERVPHYYVRCRTEGLVGRYKKSKRKAAVRMLACNHIMWDFQMWYGRSNEIKDMRWYRSYKSPEGYGIESNVYGAIREAIQKYAEFRVLCGFKSDRRLMFDLMDSFLGFKPKEAEQFIKFI